MLANLGPVDFVSFVVIPLAWALTWRSYRMHRKSGHLVFLFATSTCCAVVALGSFFLPEVSVWGSGVLGDYLGAAATVGVLAVFWIMT